MLDIAEMVSSALLGFVPTWLAGTAAEALMDVQVVRLDISWVIGDARGGFFSLPLTDGDLDSPLALRRSGEFVRLGISDE